MVVFPVLVVANPAFLVKAVLVFRKPLPEYFTDAEIRISFLSHKTPLVYFINNIGSNQFQNEKPPQNERVHFTEANFFKPHRVCV